MTAVRRGLAGSVVDREWCILPTMATKGLSMDQEHVVDHKGIEQRQSVLDRRLGLDRRRGPGRRLSEERRSAEEGHMSDEQFEFLMAVEQYKRLNTRPFPTWTEVLEVIKALGYRKVAESQVVIPAQLRKKKTEG